MHNKLIIDDVVWCYRNLLDRDPESVDVVNRTLIESNNSLINFEGLKTIFRNSQEYIELQQFNKFAASCFQNIQSQNNSLNSHGCLYEFKIDNTAITFLKKIGILISGEYGTNNKLYLKCLKKRNLNIKINNLSNNNQIFLIGEKITGDILILGSDNSFYGDQSEYDFKLNIIFWGSDSIIHIQKNVSCNGCEFHIYGPNTHISIGEDCMLSWGISMRDSDGHGIFDIKSKSLINENKSIDILSHVWIGQDCLILKGSKIGVGTIIGARSIVSKEIPDCCIAVGSPAKVIKNDHTWSRNPTPCLNEMNLIVTTIERISPLEDE
jgi:acetyltransferase-like isoleucine patch superfamily enzyme